MDMYVVSKMIKSALVAMILSGSVAYGAQSFNVEKFEQAMLMNDFKKAYNMAKPSADKGDVKAQKSMGDLFWNAAGFDQKNRLKFVSESENWYKTASQNGNGDASWRCAEFIWEREHEMNNEIINYMKLALQQGTTDYRPAATMGEMYFSGKAFAQNYKEALKLFQTAVKLQTCAWGAFDSQQMALERLIEIYSKGLGVAKDKKMVKKYKKLLDNDCSDGDDL